ncbi:NAD(P)/FAD-dependent oxidoreductase [Propionibacterium australiense]|uniref:NADH:flavin oxidoreductase / NADH oxidase family n=1 Tax=Propionibacterium australiense TaxID=119981 RepID=A0A383S9Y8_9ACTN|nr:NAD(P)/FAD-dependent oxidoreductase [Propionibacterium australiense]RLP06975.1 FAD-dependent oxidoreductase [Propionibacterium australiense]SYZ34224.1 NADH:flavin oxidoreductase / NADH oxidase family [Propionibacterium australiense]VEH89894.1 NADH oxidase [Propionibacterium australiense]
MRTLFDRTQIGAMKLKNRIFMSPMGTTGEADGAYCNEGIDYFEERAKGGAGLIVTGANVVSTRYEPRPCTELSDFHHVERLNMLIDRCHHWGAKVCVQISPGLGRQQFTDPFTPPYSAGSVSSFWFPELICKPFAVEDIHYLVERVGYSASLAVNADADAVMLHAYGGYLLDQFHSTQWNNRTDEYGGSLENRMRFTLECIEAMRSNIPAGMPIIVKFTPHQRVEGFRTLDEGVEMAKILERAGVDALLVDTGCYEEWFQAITTVYSAPGHKLDVQRAIREVVSVPLLGDGKLIEPGLAKQVVEEGTLDYVGLAHQLLADPYWPRKVQEGRDEDIRPCVGCNECLLAGFSGKHYYCAVNPQCYAEKAYALPKPDGTRRSVLVIGGGPGGMEAAITARQRGFDVELLEKSGRLGGTLWPAGGPEFKHDIIRLIESMETQCRKLGVTITLDTEATAETLADVDVDKIILATGSVPAVPPIPGIENAIPVTDYLTHQVEVGRNVVIIGGGLAGTEAACDIAPDANSVTIVEMLPDILAAAAHCLNNDQHLRAMVAERGVSVVAGARVTDISAGSLSYEKDGETVTIPADTVLNAAGFTASNELEEACLAVCDDVAVIGDAVGPRKILDAVHEGYHAIRIME